MIRPESSSWIRTWQFFLVSESNGSLNMYGFRTISKRPRQPTKCEIIPRISPPNIRWSGWECDDFQQFHFTLNKIQILCSMFAYYCLKLGIFFLNAVMNSRWWSWWRCDSDAECSDIWYLIENSMGFSSIVTSSRVLTLLHRKPSWCNNSIWTGNQTFACSSFREIMTKLN